MSTSGLVWLAVACGLGIVGAASLHALVAAFEQLPSVEERALAERRRPDGRRTMAGWLANDVEATANSAAIAYSIAEAVALVAWAFVALEAGDALSWPWWGTLVAAAAVAAGLSLLVIRALPRGLGRTHPLGTIRALAPFAAIQVAATAPIRAVVPALRRRPLSEPSDIVEHAKEALEEEEVALLKSVVDFGETMVREIMVPRTDMVTLPSGTEAEAAVRLFLRSGRSRLPIVGEGVDDLVGVLYLKDLLAATWERPEKLGIAVDALARQPFFVPESIKVDDMLRTMQKEAVHMAIVIDEFGGVAGLVTVEDALEEIVGELVDEHDAIAPEPIGLPDGSYQVPPRMPLDELGELFGVAIDDEDVETVAGLLTKALGRVPIEGSEAETHGLRLVAAGTQGRRKRLAWVVASRVEPGAESKTRTGRGGG
ncbi:MAG: HlyC/CorC family transporter [Demequinaceae bacterium]|nr:HlyC/CorC family transporter [Demequinaceae bacterium]